MNNGQTCGYSWGGGGGVCEWEIRLQLVKGLLH